MYNLILNKPSKTFYLKTLKTGIKSEYCMAGLFDYEFQLDEIKKHQTPLQKLNEIIDWEIFRKPIEDALNKEDKKSNVGRKPYDKLLMFKILILQRYYNLSDEQTEFKSKIDYHFRFFKSSNRK